MEIHEFGNKNKDTIIFIHGFQIPWQIYKPYIHAFQNDYHIIVPVLDGHGTSKFISFTKMARDLENFCLDKNIYAIYGMSMGGVLAAVLWQRGQLKIKRIIFDGTPLVSFSKIVMLFQKKFYINMTHKTKNRHQKTLHQAKKNIIPEKCFDEFLKVLDHMSDTTILNYIEAIGQFKLTDDLPCDLSIYFFHGSKINEWYAKKSAKFLQKHYPNVKVECFMGQGHCTYALFREQIMIKKLKDIFSHD